MTYEKLIKELCDVIKESEKNAISIYENIENVDNVLNELNIPVHQAKKLQEYISNSFGLLQHQDLYRQKIERVVNYVCETNNIDSSDYNLASSAKYISGDESSDENISDEELEDLIKSMQTN